VDAPFHRFVDGMDLSELSLDSLADLETIVVRLDRDEGRATGRDRFEDLGDLVNKAVLVNTGWDANWGTDRYFEGHPFLTGEAAEYLVEAGTALVGIDSLNIDDTEDARRPVHTALLGAGIPIVEHLRGLDRLPERGCRFFAVPVKVRGLGSFPVRAFGVIER
jgi:arylformamidase